MVVPGQFIETSNPFASNWHLYTAHANQAKVEILLHAEWSGLNSLQSQVFMVSQSTANMHKASGCVINFVKACIMDKAKNTGGITLTFQSNHTFTYLWLSCPPTPLHLNGLYRSEAAHRRPKHRNVKVPLATVAL
jgi:hypothetical protein